MAEPLRILLADDNPMIMEAVKHMLQKDFLIIGTIADATSVIRETPELSPDVLILDISMGALNGFDITRELRAKQCLCKIVFLTVHEEFDFVRAAFDVGASGYVFKSRMDTDLRAALDAVKVGKVFIPHSPISQ